jgi:hypothetical protein
VEALMRKFVTGAAVLALALASQTTAAVAAASTSMAAATQGSYDDDDDGAAPFLIHGRTYTFGEIILSLIATGGLVYVISEILADDDDDRSASGI